ncbi:MAG: enoyl-CoA hydratase/isomerase family protein [Planctomycetota bacterium]|nr:enoyl-CoA hydratase/isomerase family protein [Planctomycetota bacterium]
MSTEVFLTWEAPVARVRFKDERGIHILSADVRRRLNEVVGEIERLDDCRIVVFEAEGRTFIAGAQIKEFQGLNIGTAEALAKEGQRLMQRIEDLQPITVAAINGAAAGGGCELALACDQRIASANVRIGLPEVTLGLVPGWGGTVRATRLLGEHVAKRMILSGELLTAESALSLGLIDALFAAEEFTEAVERRVAQLYSGGPMACRAVKELIRQMRPKSIAEDYDREASAFAKCFSTDEAMEGSSAFLEKRPARWQN